MHARECHLPTHCVSLWRRLLGIIRRNFIGDFSSSLNNRLYCNLIFLQKKRKCSVCNGGFQMVPCVSHSVSETGDCHISTQAYNERASFRWSNKNDFYRFFLFYKVIFCWKKGWKPVRCGIMHQKTSSGWEILPRRPQLPGVIRRSVIGDFFLSLSIDSSVNGYFWRKMSEKRHMCYNVGKSWQDWQEWIFFKFIDRF